MKLREKPILASFIICIVVLILLFFEAYLLSFFFKKEDFNLSGQASMTSLSFVFAIWFASKLFKIKWCFRFNLLKLKTVIYIVLLALCLVIIQPILSFLSLIEYIGNNSIEIMGFDFYMGAGAFYYLNTILIIPILEELLFRKIILSQIKKKYNAFWAIFISSLLFSIGHLNYVQCQMAFVSGIVFGYIYFKTRRIGIVILLHIFHNMFVRAFRIKELPLNEYYYIIGFDVLMVLLSLFFMRKIIQSATEQVA